VPIGVAGELHIAHAGIARGYLNRPDLTAEKFIPDPFSQTPGGRLYKSGDRARYLESGEIEFLGRVDNQVKIRGFRIEPGEIEAALLQHPEVAAAVVVVREESTKGKHLVAYVVPHEGAEDVWTNPNRLIGEVRSFLKDKLPEYMMPPAFMLLPALPLTSSGKVDRRALPIPDQARTIVEDTFVAPRNVVEEVLAGIWAEVLGVERVGVNDNFFELGGDSILSIQVNARANKAGLKLTTKQLFQHRTIAELAAVANTGEAVRAEQGMVSGPVLLTPIQSSFFAEQQPEPQHFNQSLLLQLRSAVDVAALKRAFVEVVRQHDALRLRFRQSGAGWQQSNAVSEEHEFFSVVDLRHLAGEEQVAALEKDAAAKQASLELSAGPLLRVCYYELGVGARLLIVIHHLAVDGVSWRILLEDVARACAQVAAGEELRLGAKTTSYQEWAERLRQYAQSEAVQGQLTYWRGLVERARQVKRLAVDQDGGANTVAGARVVEMSLEPAETAALLSEVPAVYRTQINEVLLTALVEALRSWTGERRVLVELEGHGREDIGEGVDVTRTVGWFTTVYPVLLEVEEGAGVGEALKQVKEQVRGVPGHGLGWGLLRWAGEDERRELEAEAELSFNYLGQFDQVFSESSPFTIAPESAGPEQSSRGRRRHLIVINAMIFDGKLRITWGYSSAIHLAATVENLANNYVAALRRLIEHCRSTQDSGYTPSDFPEFKWTQADLDEMSTAISASLSKASSS
jgi:non-ribosomal peptide synthase protein (TIGR01720 family)